MGWPCHVCLCPRVGRGGSHAPHVPEVPQAASCPPHRLLPAFAPASNALLMLLPRDQVLTQQPCPPTHGLKLTGKAEQGGGEQSWALHGA